VPPSVQRLRVRSVPGTQRDVTHPEAFGLYCWKPVAALDEGFHPGLSRLRYQQAIPYPYVAGNRAMSWPDPRHGGRTGADISQYRPDPPVTDGTVVVCCGLGALDRCAGTGSMPRAATFPLRTAACIHRGSDWRHVTNPGFLLTTITGTLTSSVASRAGYAQSIHASSA